MKATDTNFTALDIGSSKISILAAHLSFNGDARIGYQGIYKSSGIKSGVIKDYKLAENSIISSIYNLEKEIDKNITNVSIAVSGMGIKSLYIYQKIRLTDGRVSSLDIKTLHTKALEKFEEGDKTVLHYFPIEYTLDQNSSINNPVGMFGNVLGCRMHVVTADSSQVNNFVDCLNKCHIKVSDIIVGVFASSIAVLTEDEKSLGSVVIDFGATTTSFAIFSGGQMIYTGYVPLGGNHITSDIAKILSISLPTAEKLKVLYGSVLESNNERENLIYLSELEPNPNQDLNTNITPNDLSMIISARVEEIIELVKAQYDNLGVDHLVGRRVVLTGGGSLLRGVKEMVAENFRKQVRQGIPLNIPGFDSDYTSQNYCASLGLIKNEMIKLKKRNTLGVASSKFMDKISAWFKDPS